MIEFSPLFLCSSSCSQAAQLMPLREFTELQNPSSLSLSVVFPSSGRCLWSSTAFVYPAHLILHFLSFHIRSAKMLIF